MGRAKKQSLHKFRFSYSAYGVLIRSTTSTLYNCFDSCERGGPKLFYILSLNVVEGFFRVIVITFFESVVRTQLLSKSDAFF